MGSTKISTVKKGDRFEDKAYDIIHRAISSGEFGFPLQVAKVFRKAKYFSAKEQKDIVFDLAIEIWPTGAKNFQNLLLVECKSYSNKKVPIGDIRKFSESVKDVAELNGKAIFITDSDYTNSTVERAERTGMMLIRVDEDDKHDIILHKDERENESSIVSGDGSLEAFFKRVFQPTGGSGLKRLSSDRIEEIVREIHLDFDPEIVSNCKMIDHDKLVVFFKERYSINFELEANLNIGENRKALGRYELNNRTVYIDKSLSNQPGFGFVLAHEIGHAILHSHLNLSQAVYDDFEDSQYDPVLDKHILSNEKNWIEWQANRFATFLLMPERTVKVRVKMELERIDIMSRFHIYVDKQPWNMRDYKKVMMYLVHFFGVSKTSLEIRLQELDLIKYGDFRPSYKGTMGDLLKNLDVN